MSVKLVIDYLTNSSSYELTNDSSHEDIDTFLNKNIYKLSEFFFEKTKDDKYFSIGVFDVKRISLGYSNKDIHMFRFFYNEEQAAYFELIKFSNGDYNCKFIAGPNRTLLLQFLSQLNESLLELDYYN